MATTRVFINGVFDLLHVGHVDFIQQAASYGDCLIVGINDDESVRELKGDQRPIMPIEHRMRMVASIAGVDRVYSFSSLNPLPLLIHLYDEGLGPHRVLKGQDYCTTDPKKFPEQEYLLQMGCEIHYYTDGPFKYYSTTRIINDIQDLSRR